jgi:CRISPR/Cas system-associated exonuclease Cas4 (RecB family)
MNLTTILDMYCLERQIIETAARDDSLFRVSDAGKCRLMRYWKRQGKLAEPTYTTEVLRAMQAGILLHSWLLQILKEHDRLLASEIPVMDDHRLGHFDALVSLDGRSVLYDFKTINGKKMYYLTKDGQPKADVPHQYQIATYAAMLFPHPDELRIAYLNRDSLEIVEVPVLYDNVYAGVSEDWSRLIEAWKAQQEPEANPASWECKYCAYNTSCTYKPF